MKKTLFGILILLTIFPFITSALIIPATSTDSMLSVSERQAKITELQQLLVQILQQLIQLLQQQNQSQIQGSTASSSLNNENSLLSNLSPEAQSFFKKSISIREGYSESDAYKHFNRDRDNDGNVDVMDANGYLTLNPYGGYIPNPVLYPQATTTIPNFFYRYVKDCATKATIERQIIYTANGYQNYIGQDRYPEQCIADGSFDEYYLESNTKLE